MRIFDSDHDSESMLTVEDCAEYLRVHPSTIYRLVKKKELPAFKVGRAWRFTRESIDRWRAGAERRRPLSYRTRNGSGATSQCRFIT
jgi:excisionase family DNA binding protein